MSTATTRTPTALPRSVRTWVGATAPKWPHLMLLGAVLTVPLELFTAGVPGAHHATADEFFYVAAAGGWLISSFRSRRTIIPRSPMAGAALLVVVTLLPGLVIAGDPFLVQQRVILWTVFLIGLTMLARDATPPMVERVLWMAATAATIVSAMAILGIGLTEASPIGAVAADREAGSFGQVNTLASYLVLVLPIQIVLALRGTTRQRNTATVMALISIGGLASTLSRAGLIGFAAVVVLLALWRPFRRILLVVLGAVLVLFFAGIDPSIGHFDPSTLVARIGQIGTGDQSGQLRETIYRVAPKIFADHPIFGIGAHNLQSVGALYGLSDPGFTGPFANLHSSILEVPVETGIVGTLAVLALIYVTARTVALLTRYGTPDVRRLTFGISVGLVGICVDGAVQEWTPSVPIMGLIFVLLGCLAALRRDLKPAPA